MRKNPGFMQGSWHPYTKALLDSVMPPDPLKARKQKVPAVHEGKSEGGCPYFGSCGYKMEMCKDAAPEMYDFEGRAVSCHLYFNAPEEIRIIR